MSALDYSSTSFIAHWLCTLLFSIATGVEDDAKVIDFVLSSDYQAIFEAVHELVCSPYQTPFTLYQIIVFALRFYSRTQLLDVTDFGDTQATEEFVMTLRIFYLMALHAIGDAELSDVEQLELSGLTSLSEYKNIRQNLMNAVASPQTGTIQIGYSEWEDYLVDISRLTVLISRDDAELNAITAVIDVLFKYMHITSSKGNMPLGDLSFFYPSLPPLVFDEWPSPVDTDLVLSSPFTTSLPDSFDDFEPSSPRFFTVPSSPSEWNPSADPIVDCGRVETTHIAPGSLAAVYSMEEDSDYSSFDSAKVYHPSPKRAFGLDIIELEALVEQDVVLLEKTYVESRISAVKARDWREWIDWCRVQA